MKKEQRKAERAYRLASVEKHVQMVKLMELQGVPAATIKREKRLVKFMRQLARGV